jgi:cytoskeletal protein CcmA (bactofilin family)
MSLFHVEATRRHHGYPTRFGPDQGEIMWRNKESQSTAPSPSPDRAVETLNLPGDLTEARRPASKPAHAPARLGPGVTVKGQITGNEDLQVDGRVEEGPISLGDGRLTVGLNGQVTAQLAAREIVVYGKVDGNLHAGERIEIKKEGSVIGDLTTRRIVIEDGASFKGHIEIGQSSKQASASLDGVFAPTAPKSA